MSTPVTSAPAAAARTARRRSRWRRRASARPLRGRALDELIVHGRGALRQLLVLRRLHAPAGSSKAQSLSFASFGQLVARVPQLRIHLVLDQVAEQLDRRPLRPDHLVADDARDDLVVAHPPDGHALVPLDQQLGQLVELLELAAALVQLDDRDAPRRGGACGTPPRGWATRGGCSEARRVEPAAVPEDRAGSSACTPTATCARACRGGGGRFACTRPTGAAGGWPRRARPRRAGGSPPRPPSRRASATAPRTGGRSGRELVTVRPFLRGLLEREQLVGAEVALVVARRRRPREPAGSSPRHLPRRLEEVER